MGYSDKTLGRQAALQFLFGRDCSPDTWAGGFDEFWEMDPLALSREAFEDGERPAWEPESAGRIKSAAVRDHARALAGAVEEHQENLDRRISGAVQNWSPDRVGRVEWVILRIGLCEMEHFENTPAQVVISEAVNLAKMFCAEESPGFINAVLDRLRRGAAKTPDMAPDTGEDPPQDA